MTEPAAANRLELEHAQTWAESFSSVLGQIAGAAVACTVRPESPADLSPPGDGDLWVMCACSGELRGEISLRLGPASIQRLAQIFMAEPLSPEAELNADHREAAVELLRQVAGVVATSLKAHWGEIQLRLEPASGAPSWPASLTLWIRAGEESAAAPLIELHFSAALSAALRSDKSATQYSDKSDDAKHSAAVPSSAALEESTVNLERLMEVELAVTLRFGSRQMLLSEVLDLNPGSVVALDRQVQEPVDLLLDGRLLARGEVVVVDGNLGLRVTEIAPAAGT